MAQGLLSFNYEMEKKDKIEVRPEAEKDFAGIDGSTKKDVARKNRCQKSHFVQFRPRFSQGEDMAERMRCVFLPGDGLTKQSLDGGMSGAVFHY